MVNDGKFMLDIKILMEVTGGYNGKGWVSMVKIAAWAVRVNFYLLISFHAS